MLRAMFANRYRAGAVYLAASVVIAIAALALVLRFYPAGLFSAAGGLDLFLIIALVDVVIGPLLIFIVFVPGKRGLGFDLVAIALLQVGTLVYGLHVLYESRPVYLVFVKDRFEMVRANELAEAELRNAGRFAELPTAGPRTVGARIPVDPRERARIVVAAMGGADLQHFPTYYVDYDTVRGQVRAQARSIGRLRELNGASSQAIDGLVAQTSRPEAELAFLPLKADKRELAAIVDARNGELLRVAKLRPWK